MTISKILKSVAFGVLIIVTAPALSQDVDEDINPYSKQHDFVVTLLGTGTPKPEPDRMGMSTLVQVNGMKFLFDAGRGNNIRLWQMGLNRGDLDAVFLTHLHSDHLVGLPDLLMSGWMIANFKNHGDERPFVVYGPGEIEGRIGTTETVNRIKSAFEADQYIRRNDEKLNETWIEIEGHDISSSGVIYEKGGIRITAFSVDHGEWAKPNYGYRVDYDDRSVLLSGDARYSPDGELLTYAKDVDVLIHSVAAAPDAILKTHVGEAVMGHHISPQQAGEVFTQSRPKLAVYSHIVLMGNPKAPRPNVSDIIEQTRETYDGPLLVGSDLTSLVIDKDGVTVRAYNATP